jgi:hypothetical protein
MNLGELGSLMSQIETLPCQLGSLMSQTEPLVALSFPKIPSGLDSHRKAESSHH